MPEIDIETKIADNPSEIYRALRLSGLGPNNEGLLLLRFFFKHLCSNVNLFFFLHKKVFFCVR